MSNKANQCHTCGQAVQQATDQQCEDILVAFMESSYQDWVIYFNTKECRYWDFDEPERERPLWKDGGGVAIYMDDEDNNRYSLDVEDMREGIRLAAGYMGVTTEAFAEDHDAASADMAVQFAVLGEMIYG